MLTRFLRPCPWYGLFKTPAATLSARKGPSMSANEGGAFLRVPGAVERLIGPLASHGEPQHDETVEEHPGGGAALDGRTGPALRLLEAEMRLAVLERLLDRPALGIEDEDRFGAQARISRVEGLARTTVAAGCRSPLNAD